MTVVEQLLDWKADGIISDCKWLSPFTATKLIVDFDFYSTQILATFAAWLSTAAFLSRQTIPSSEFWRVSWSTCPGRLRRLGEPKFAVVWIVDGI